MSRGKLAMERTAVARIASFCAAYPDNANLRAATADLSNPRRNRAIDGDLSRWADLVWAGVTYVHAATRATRVVPGSSTSDWSNEHKLGVAILHEILRGPP